MNKFKKLAIASVSLVMAGTMALSFAACGDKGKEKEKPNVNATDKADEWDVLNDDGTLNYDSYKRDSEVTLNLAICHDSATTSTAYHNLGAPIIMPDGATYEDDDIKPAWAAMGKDLNIKWNDLNTATKTSANLKKLVTDANPNGAGKLYDTTDMFTSDLSEVVKYANDGTDILNLADYLNCMPNFTAFLENNPVVYLSLLQYGMSTTDGSGKIIYVAPYFDGNDDIERYCIIRHDWAKTILNGDAELAGSTAWGKAASVQPFFTESYEIESLKADGSGTQKIKKDFAAAASDVKKSGSALGKAYAAIAGDNNYDGTGNIVDIMNKAIAKNQNATGAQLANLFRAYIDVAYKGAYKKDSRANLFIGYDAAWDVDDLVALLRCVTTNSASLNVGERKVVGIAPRTGQNDRTPDIVRLACQLYGVRGADSRLEYTYIDAQGNLKDARTENGIYDAMARFNTLKNEGLVATYPASDSFKGERGVGKDMEVFMEYDYSQTQTLNGFYHEDPSVPKSSDPISANDNFFFAPIITPVSKWDTNSNGTAGEEGEIIRFTESWRSTKTGGLALNGALAKAGNEAKLKAALQFVDYLYSTDGQIVSTFGPMAANAEGDGGFWYNEKATNKQVKDGQYFTFKGVNYSGFEYKGRYTPTITTALYDSFKDKEVKGWHITENTNANIAKSKLNFTNYARQLIGSTLPVCVKDQSFENQLTSGMGKTGAGIVGTALDKGVIKGMTLNIKPETYWFTVVPSGLPVMPLDQTGVIDNLNMNDYKYMTGTQKSNKNFFSIFNYIIQNGLTGEYNQQDVTYTVPSNVEDLVAHMNDIGATARAEAYAKGWNTAKSYWTYLNPVK